MEGKLGIPPGDRIAFGRYEILEVLGQGGAGCVYRARDILLDRVVALKVLNSEVDTSAKARFVREAQALARLDHPNIVKLYDFGFDGSICFLTMACVQGMPLDTMIPHTGLPVRTALDIMERIARAVQVVHDHGLVHRDLKPSNVILDEQRRPVLIDFGLAKDLTTPGKFTAEGSLVGTIRYMAPEQLAGDASQVDARTDVYALGVMLYEMLTGRLPFSDTSFWELSKKIMVHEPPDPTKFNPKISRDLSTILIKALEKNKSARYPSAQAFADDLRRVLQQERPLPLGLDIYRSRIIRLVRRNRWRFAVASLMLAVAAAVLASIRTAAPQLRTTAHHVEHRPLWMFQARDSLDTTPVVHAGRVYLCGERWLYCLDLQTGALVWETQIEKSETQPDVVDGTVFVVTNAGELIGVDAATGGIRQRLLLKFPAKSAVVHGRYVAANGAKTMEPRISKLFRVDGAGSILWDVTVGEGISVPVMAGDRVVFGAKDGIVRCVDTTGAELWSHRSGSDEYHYLSVADDRVFVGSAELHCLNLITGELLWRIDVDRDIEGPPLIFGELVIVAAESGQVVAVHRSDGREAWRQQVDPLDSGATLVGTTLVVGTDTGLVYGLEVATGAQRWVLRASAAVESTSIAAGDRVLFTCKDHRLYCVAARE